MSHFYFWFLEATTTFFFTTCLVTTGRIVSCHRCVMIFLSDKKTKVSNKEQVCCSGWSVVDRMFDKLEKERFQFENERLTDPVPSGPSLFFFLLFKTFLWVECTVRIFLFFPLHFFSFIAWARWGVVVLLPFVLSSHFAVTYWSRGLFALLNTWPGVQSIGI